MHVIVAKLSVPRVPDPVPVVMQFGTRERNMLCRAGREGIVDARWNFVRPWRADRTATTIDDTARELYFSELPLLHVFDGRCVGAAGPILRSPLTNPAGLPGNLNHAPAFAHVMADGLLDIDVLAR